MKTMRMFLVVTAATVAALSVAGCVGKGKAPPPVAAPAAIVTKG
jgi:outer membrane murein-binding lipoprotein Lpp